MLVRDAKRLIFVAPLLIFAYLGLRLYFDQSALPSGLGGWIESTFSSKANGISDKSSPGYNPFDTLATNSRPSPPSTSTFPGPDLPSSFETFGPGDFEPSSAYNEVYSVSTKDRKYFAIKFGDKQAMNPNIIPHPILENTWIIVAQQFNGPNEPHAFFTELVCNAAFLDDVLQCIDPPTVLPIAATVGDKCDGDLAFFAINTGPHDARVFFGPKVPYTVYGSNSLHTCFGQWVQDLRALVPWGLDMIKQDQFRLGTELQRPLPYNAVEKNWFIFWDREEQAYAHYEVAPKRVFAKLSDDGSAGLDIAPLASVNDDKCMAKYMPKVAPKLESVHQATNSLAITLCNRADPTCVQTDANTFIFTIFQHKTYYDFHSVYWPYVMVFEQRAPFELYGISQKPIYIHGRETLSETQSQMFYVVSMSWKSRVQRYHGFLDDVLFLAFGVEDERSGGIDIVARDIFQGLGLCSDS
ncbi:uncharacterized protein BCR38DRAFT_384 [Pseudomassariella vexata]|uniref:Uncharacterized protein n=1 Tax=Pseudomassariella vexata TaxID=1141098 RepID=A0A1Y2EH45_9PEZI|nr:uncharacterized protein BCR38DRAFT_384 [Pseudomassariella vexata]ORY70892.1 hypothetical protein BCR38DRAFT_384 [Pseudomassariella vexata]